MVDAIIIGSDRVMLASKATASGVRPASRRDIALFLIASTVCLGFGFGVWIWGLEPGMEVYGV